MRLTHILFDADDTLFDYKGAARLVLEDTLRGVGAEWRPELNDIYQEINQGLWKKRERGLIDMDELQRSRFKLFFDRIGSAADPEAANALYLERLAFFGRRMTEGAEDTVRELSGKYTLAIVTNGLSSVQHARFDASPIAAYMSGIFVSGDMGLKKPDRGYFDRVLKELGSPERRETLIVGDSLSSDIRGGINAGIRTCWYNPEGDAPPHDAAPDMELRELRDLPGMLLS